LWGGTDKGLTEADFGYLELVQLHTLAAGKLDYYIVDGMNFGCNQVMVAPDSPMKSAADLKGKTIALGPDWGTSFRPPPPPTYIREELKAHGVDPKDVTVTLIPWAFPGWVTTLPMASRRASSTRRSSPSPVRSRCGNRSAPGRS